MEKAFIENKTFEKEDFTANPLVLGDYENCSFINCRFAEADLSNMTFTESRFTDCNFSSAHVSRTGFRDISFKGCKMLGLRFNDCSSLLFKVNFEDCSLAVASFYKWKLKGTVFKNCNLQDVDFAEADLSQAIFDNCDLLNAIFDSSNLEKADFTTAYNYAIDPVKNKMKKAKFSQSGLAGLLYQFDIEIA